MKQQEKKFILLTKKNIKNAEKCIKTVCFSKETIYIGHGFIYKQTNKFFINILHFNLGRIRSRFERTTQPIRILFYIQDGETVHCTDRAIFSSTPLGTDTWASGQIIYSRVQYFSYINANRLIQVYLNRFNSTYIYNYNIRWFF